MIINALRFQGTNKVHYYIKKNLSGVTNNQRLKLLDIALKHSLPKQSIKQHIVEDTPQDIQITIVDSNGNEKVNRKSLDNFKFKDLAE